MYTHIYIYTMYLLFDVFVHKEYTIKYICPLERRRWARAGWQSAIPRWQSDGLPSLLSPCYAQIFSCICQVYFSSVFLKCISQAYFSSVFLVAHDGLPSLLTPCYAQIFSCISQAYFSNVFLKCISQAYFSSVFLVAEDGLTSLLSPFYAYIHIFPRIGILIIFNFKLR